MAFGDVLLSVRKRADRMGVRFIEGIVRTVYKVSYDMICRK